VSGEDESSLANVIGLPLQAATYRERKRMKIIHTSDWHIGREFESESLAGDQLAFIEWLVETVRSHSVDLVIIAGQARARTPGLQPARRPAPQSFRYQYMRSWV